MTVSSPPSRPDPDGGETGSGNGRSPPPLPPSNPENSNASFTMNSQIQSTGENAGLSGNNNTPQSEVEQGNLETGEKGDLGNSPSMPGNESAGMSEKITFLLCTYWYITTMYVGEKSNYDIIILEY